MKAGEKEKILEWAKRKMSEVEDMESVEKICSWAEERIRGSNKRKWDLWEARDEAMKRLK